jgi:hypothetical protein
LFCGHEKGKAIANLPIPPEHEKTDWALPYCTRSFIDQASRQIEACGYQWRGSTDMMGEPVHEDDCWEDENPGDYAFARTRCHLLSGWIRGRAECPLWDQLKTYCQTVTEQKFLWAYLSLVKGRNFPMLLPQVRIGIAERRRPDFVLFVSLAVFHL